MRYVALLYSITLTEGRRLVMSDWRAMLETCGVSDVRTVIATGNAVFSARKTPINRLEAALETAFAARFGKRIATILRDAPGWRTLAAGNPFPRESLSEGSRVMVRVGRGPLSADAMSKLKGFIAPGEKLASVGDALWSYYPGRASTSRLFSAIARLNAPAGTMRNWNSVQRISALLDEGEA